jgi:hypothetical protein
MDRFGGIDGNAALTSTVAIVLTALLIDGRRSDALLEAHKVGGIGLAVIAAGAISRWHGGR